MTKGVKDQEKAERILSLFGSLSQEDKRQVIRILINQVEDKPLEGGTLEITL